MSATTLLFAIFLMALSCLFLFFVGYPVALALSYVAYGRRRLRRRLAAEAPDLSVSLIIPCRNAAPLIPAKVENLERLGLPGPGSEIIFFSDGSTDKTLDILAERSSDRIRILSSKEHIGKCEALNRAIGSAKGEIIVVSDVDAILADGSVARLLGPFRDPYVGGVFGQRVIRDTEASMQEGQRAYIRCDSLIKTFESALGRVTSSDGKLLAFRRELFEPIPPGSVDDLFIGLTVLRKNHLFLFTPHARAYVKAPARDSRHELARRYRVTLMGLHTIAQNRQLFNPLTYGMFGFRLFINKILRRTLPMQLLALYVSTGMLSPHHPLLFALFLAQSSFYLFALLSPFIAKTLPERHILARAAGVAYYFCLANFGVLKGVVFYLLGQRSVKWEPVKG